MKIAVFFGVYEAEKSFASQTLGQLISILQQHEVHILVLDDASHSRVGHRLAQTFASQPHVTMEVLRIEKSSGFRGSMDRTLKGFRHLANLEKDFDSVIRLDADLFFNRLDIARMFDPALLPAKGLVGSVHRFRRRDFIQILADVLPFGFRRRSKEGVIENKWELKRLSPVWWSDIGIRALWHGFWMRYITGSIQIMGGETLKALHSKGWLERAPLGGLGLLFAEDVMTTIMVKALNHPVVDFDSILPDWNCNLAINPHENDWRTIRAQELYVVHPLKGDSWSLEMRKMLSAFHPEDLGPISTAAINS